MSLIFALNEFGAALGLPQMSMPAMGSVSFMLEDGQTFSLEEVGDDLLMFTPVATSHVPVDHWVAVLQACDVRELAAQDPPLQLGARGMGADTTAALLLRWPVQGLVAAQLVRGLHRLQDYTHSWLSAPR